MPAVGKQEATNSTYYEFLLRDLSRILDIDSVSAYFHLAKFTIG